MTNCITTKAEPSWLRRLSQTWIPRKSRPWGSLGSLTVAAAVAATLSSTVARGDLQVVQEDVDGGLLIVYQMTVSPAPEPAPPLKHRLTLREADLKTGNAALHYLRAFSESGLSGAWKRLEKEYGFDEIHSWYGDDTPLAELPLEKVRSAAAAFDTLVSEFVVPASNRRGCDWGHHIDELTGTELFALLLPEIQETRSLSRMLALRTRAAIADGDYDGALEQLRMNFRLGVNTSRAPFLVSSLVGIAEASIAHQGVIELIAAPNSPNLYWAMAELPRPLISIRDALRMELSILPQVFPFLKDAETAEHSPQEWARLLAEATDDARALTSQGGGTPDGASLAARQAAVAGMSLVIYPGAKRRLIESGMDRERVEQMPVGQVLAVDAEREHRRIANEFEKLLYMPYHEARARGAKDPLDAQGGDAITRGYGYVLASLLLPATRAVRTAETRLERHRNAIQVVEALRMHAAATGGLPATLDEISVVPVPLNPATGAPFEYRLDGETAVLDLPSSDGMPGISWRFEIRLEK